MIDFNVENDHFKEETDQDIKNKIDIPLNTYWKPIVLPELVSKIEKDLKSEVYTKKVGANEELKPENFGQFLDDKTRRMLLRDEKTTKEIEALNKGVVQPNLYKMEEKEVPTKIAVEKLRSGADERIKKLLDKESQKLAQMGQPDAYQAKKLKHDTYSDKE